MGILDFFFTPRDPVERRKRELDRDAKARQKAERAEQKRLVDMELKKEREQRVREEALALQAEMERKKEEEKRKALRIQQMDGGEGIIEIGEDDISACEKLALELRDAFSDYFIIRPLLKPD